ncbi:MAG: hypothetical protein R3293_21445, partial [Candidatus Promineifilaceae bacterium]|nr:hypothetical protein [Candidatus Promineifilaceae bacterium]
MAGPRSGFAVENGRFHYNILMAGEILQTKLHVPQLRPSLVPRPHLIEKLNDGLDGKLTLISAPAGFGKTTLVAEWGSQLAGSSRIPHSEIRDRLCWLSLDEGDNDLTRFLVYFITALSQAGGIEDAFGAEMVNILHTPQPSPAEVILTAVINQIAALPNKIVLIFDDYHCIDTSSIDDALAYLLEHLPPQLHLVIATRDDPHLPVARLRSRGQLTELRAADLRFSSSESAEFLNQVMGLNLAAEDVAALESRTEGWIAGLQLAAIALQGPASQPGRREVATLVNSFTGSHRFVMDYLIEEVLEQQPDNVQTFLLQTAVLKRMNSSLCNAVTGLDDGRTILDTLERANLFIVPLDEERQWYRYHHLFADLLQRRMRQSQRDILPTLHDRASAWYAQNGFVSDAIEHALHAGDFERAAQLLIEPVDTIWRRGEHAKLRRWLEMIPLSIVMSKAKLCIFHAWYLFAGGRHDLAEEVLQAAEEALDAHGEQTSTPIPPEAGQLQLQGRIAAIRSFMASYRGDVPAIIRQARQALALLPEVDLTWRSSAAITLGDAQGFAGDMAAAYEARLAAAQACQAAGDLYFVLIANLKLAITLRAMGKLQATIDMCRQQMHLMRDRGLASTPLAGWCLAVWGETLAELNDLDGALHHAQKGVDLIERGIDLAMRGWSYLCLVRVLFSRGAIVEAEALIQNLADLGRESDIPPWIANQMSAWQVRLWLEQENVSYASQWITERGLDTAVAQKTLPQMDFFLLIDYITVARILLAQGRLDETIWLLQNLQQVAEAGGRITRLIEIRLLQALAFQAADIHARALDALTGVFTYAEPEGFIRIFLDEGPPMTRLLQTAARHKMAPDYVRRLLSTFPLDQPEQPAAA